MTYLLHRRYILVCIITIILLLSQYGLQHYTKGQPSLKPVNHAMASTQMELIHFIWIEKYLSDSKIMPNYDISNINDWKAMNPDFKIIVWKRDNILQKFPEVADISKKLPNVAWISDILRLKIIYEYGGLYVDTDVKPIKPIRQLISRYNKTGFVICERPRTSIVDMTGHCTYMGNAIIFSRPKNRIILNMFEKIKDKTFDAIQNNSRKLIYNPRIYGPGLVTRVLIPDQSITVLGSITFFPCDWQYRSKCIYKNFLGLENTYGMHDWKMRWRKHHQGNTH